MEPETPNNTSERTGLSRLVDIIRERASHGTQTMSNLNPAETVSTSVVTPLTQPISLAKRATDANITRQVPSLQFAKRPFADCVESLKENQAQEETSTNHAQEVAAISTAQELATTSTAQDVPSTTLAQDVLTTSLAQNAPTASVSPQGPKASHEERLPIAVISPQASTATDDDLQDPTTVNVKPEEQASKPSDQETAIRPLREVPTTVDVPQVPATRSAPTVGAERPRQSLSRALPARPVQSYKLLADRRIKWVRCPAHLEETFSTVLVDHLGRLCRAWPRGMTWSYLNNILRGASYAPDLFVFTDGSSRARASGASLVVKDQDEVLYRGVVSLNSKLNSMDMEIVAINKAFAWLDDNKESLRGKTVCVLSDCKHLLQKMQKGLVATSWLGIQVPTTQQLVWMYCPAHAHVPGNIMSHTLAHHAASSAWRYHITRSGRLQWMCCPRNVRHLFSTVVIDPRLGPHCRHWREGNTWRTLYLSVTSITSSLDLEIFTGASNCFRESGGSMVVMRQGSIIYESVSSVRPGKRPQDMEIMVITTALRWLSFHNRTFTRSVCIFTSNMNLLKKLQAGKMPTLWLEGAKRLEVGHLVWAYCPSHSFVDGNQRAYQLARRAAMGGEYC